MHNSCLKLDWESSESHAFINPRLPEFEKETLDQMKCDLKGHIFLTTSGTHSLKWVALSKKAFLIAADVANKHLKSTLEDIWISSLPYYHVGGLSVYARAYLGRTFVYRYDAKWNPQEWANYVEEMRGSLTSLVPTQLWDLIDKGVKPPSKLRAILVGGQSLSADLYEKAKKAGWHVLPTFGMTECCSQVATADFDSPQLKLLPHVQARVSQEGRLSIKSDSLLTGYFDPRFRDPKEEGWFETDDRVLLEGNILTPQGRWNDLIKVKGELVNMFLLEEILNNLKLGKEPVDLALVSVPDERAGHKIKLYHTPYAIQPLIQQFNDKVIPEARIFETVELPELPKSALGKIEKSKLASI